MKSNPTTGSGALTRERILDAAEALFVTNGYDGTSTRAIAQSAKANIGLLSYYFGSKQGIFTAVLEREIDKVVARISQLINNDVEPIHSLRLYLLETADAFCAPMAPVLALAVRESLTDVPTPTSESVAALLQPHRAALTNILEAGMHDGSIVVVDAKTFYPAVMGAMAAAAAWPSMNSRPGTDRVTFVVDMLMAAVRNGAHASGTGSALPEVPKRKTESREATLDEDPFEIGVID